MSVTYLEEWLRKQGGRSALKSQSPPNSKSEKRGPKLTEEQVLERWTQELADVLHLYMCLDTAKRRPFTVKSQFARSNAAWVGFAASNGFLSTQVAEFGWGNKWLITPRGEGLLKELEDDLQEFRTED